MNRFFKKEGKRYMLYVYSFYLVSFLCVLALYFWNPFNNECIKGNCDNGHGVYVFHSRIRYEGEWKNGKRNGRGILTYPDGFKYEGEWKNGRMHGQGTKTYAKRNYTGEWSNGLKSGQGTKISVYFDEKGSPKIRSLYKGEWKNGLKHGQGTYTDFRRIIPKRLRKDSKRFGQYKYIGEWKKALASGYGTEYATDGSVYKGEWKAGLKHGKGTAITPNGMVYEGKWVNDEML